MKNKINKLVDIMSQTLSSSDVVASKQLAKISAIITSSRIEKGMNQKQFAEFAGVSQSMVSKWESGDCNFTLQSLVHIAAKLDIPMQPPFVFERLAYTSRSNVVDFPGKWNSSSSITPTYLSAEDLMEN